MSNPIHISQLKANPAPELGSKVTQGGEVYTVVGRLWSSATATAKLIALYYTWDGAQGKSDIFRSVVNSQGAVGQVRWEWPASTAPANIYFGDRVQTLY